MKAHLINAGIAVLLAALFAVLLVATDQITIPT